MASNRLLKRGVQRGTAPLLGVRGYPPISFLSPLPGKEGGRGMVSPLLITNLAFDVNAI